MFVMQMTTFINDPYMYLLPEEFFSVVKAVEVLELSQELYGWLRAITVQFWHIQIIHKHHNLFISRST